VSKDCGTSRSAQSCVEKYHELCTGTVQRSHETRTNR
jgi:hypothetical protein